MIDCCQIALSLGKTLKASLAVNVLSLAIYAGYNVIMRKDQIKLAKENQAIKKELAEVERVNGKEKAQIKELQELSISLQKEITELKEKLN